MKDFPFYVQKIVENLWTLFKLISPPTPVILTVFPYYQLYPLLKSMVVMLMDMVMLIQIHTNTTSNVLSPYLKYYLMIQIESTNSNLQSITQYYSK